MSLQNQDGDKPCSIVTGIQIRLAESVVGTGKMPAGHLVLAHRKCSIFLVILFATYLQWKGSMRAVASDEMLEITDT
jgi:hypothetical protein